MTTGAPAVSVIVPALDEEKNIVRCLEALRAQTAPADSYEIIVVDNGSHDRTRELAQSCGVHVLAQPRRGAASARNLGAENARGEIILFVDSNCEADTNWVQAMTAPFADAHVVGVSGEKKTRQIGLLARFIQIEFDDRYDRIDKHRWIDFVDSATAGYRREVFLANGGFDASLLEAEDAELSFRLAERGYGLVLARDAVVYRHHPESPFDYWHRKFRYARWRSVVYARHPRKMAFDTRTPQTQKVQVVLAFAIVPALAGALVWAPLGWVALALAVLFLVMALPFAARCWRTDPRIGLIAPLLQWGVAYASGIGIVYGALGRPVRPPSTAEDAARPG